MTKGLSIKETQLMLVHVAQQLVKNEDYLTEIDEKIGDGDHGIGMAMGFSAVAEGLPKMELTSIEAVFQAVGTILLDTMGGASGVLFGTLFVSGTIGQEQHGELTTDILATILKGALMALKERGKAKAGDKTMIDALEPAVKVLDSSRERALSSSLLEAAKEAAKGVEKTKEMEAKFGRAKYYGRQGIGHQDPGATSVGIIFSGMSEWVMNQSVKG